MSNISGIRFFAVCASVALSVWSIHQDQLINDDGILYLITADLISQGDWEKAFSVFNWLFYPAIISLLDKLSGLGLENSAYFINACFSALIVYSFVSIIREISTNNRIILITALIILVYPKFNEYRSDIIRDFGYWAFYLTSILQFIRYTNKPSLVAAWLWFISMFLAFLFRIEALIFFFLVPLAYISHKGMPATERLPHLSRLYSPMAAALIFVFIALLIFLDDLPKLITGWNKPVQMAQLFWHALADGLSSKAEILREHFLIKYSEGYAWAIVLASLLIILITEALKGVGLVFTALAAYAIYRDAMFEDRRIRHLWYCLIWINIIILALFIITQGFLVGRYLVALTLTAMLAVPFALNYLYAGWREPEEKTHYGQYAFPAVILLIIYMAADGLVSTGPGKAYIAEAGTWIKNNTTANDMVYSSDAALLYTAEKLTYKKYMSLTIPDADRFDSSKPMKERNPLEILKNDDLSQYHYLAVRIKRKHHDLEASINDIAGNMPLKVFINNKGDRVLIYKLNL